MRIGIDARAYGSFFSGIWVFTKHCIDELEQLDNENEYYIFLDDLGYSEYEPKNPKFHKVLSPYPKHSLVEQTQFALALYKAKLNLVHFMDFHAPLLYRGRSIVTIRDLALSLYPGRRMASSWARFTYKTVIGSIARRSKKILSFSNRSRKDIVEILGVREEKIEIVPFGIDIKLLSHTQDEKEVERIREELGIRTKKYILCTGSFREHKNLVRLIEAFAVISKEFEDVSLVLAGKEDPSFHDVRDAIVEHKLQDRVRIVGFVDDAKYATLLHGAHIYVSPSLYEGFGISVLEALSAGVPVACSSGSSFEEVAGKENALYFSPLRLGEMIEKIRLLLQDENLRLKLIESGKERAKAFSWKTTAKKMLELYSEFEHKSAK